MFEVVVDIIDVFDNQISAWCCWNRCLQILLHPCLSPPPHTHTPTPSHSILAILFHCIFKQKTASSIVLPKFILINLGKHIEQDRFSYTSLTYFCNNLTLNLELIWYLFINLNELLILIICSYLIRKPDDCLLRIGIFYYIFFRFMIIYAYGFYII